MPSHPLVSPSESILDAALERAVEGELQSRREEFALDISRSLAGFCVAASLVLTVVWFLARPDTQILIYAVLLLPLALGAGFYPALQRRNRKTGGLSLVYGPALAVVLLGPLLIPSLMPAIAITDILAMMVATLLMGDRGSRWLVSIFALAYLADIIVVAVLGWSPFPPLEHSLEVWVTGIVSLVIMLTAILILRRIVLGLGQQFSRAQRLNLQLERQIQALNETQETLNQERNLLRTLIDTVPANVYIKDMHSRFIDANAETIRKFGAITPNDLIGKTDFDFFTPELAARYFADDQAVLQSGQPLLNSEELTVDQRTGQTLWLLTTKAPIRNERGEVTGLVGVGLDITKRKRAEQALEVKAEEERRFQVALQALYAISIELTPIDPLDDFYRRVVELALERLGFDRFGLLLYDAEHSRLVGTYGTDAQGKLVAEHQLQFDPATLTEMLRRTLETTERFAFSEHVPLFSNLEPIGFGWNAAALLRNGEQALGWVAADNAVHHQPASKLLLDLLALYAQTVGTLLGRKRAEQALRENEAKLQTFFEMLPVGVSILNRDGQIIDMNPALARILGLSREGLFSGADQSRKYIFSDGRPMERSELPGVRALVEHQPLQDVVVGVIKEDETVVWTSVSVVPLPTVPSDVMVVTTDITERKQAEAQALALAAEQQRGKLLRDFITDVSHDLRTPLSIIGTSAFLASKTTDPAKRTQYSQRIEEQISRLKLLLDTFVELAHLEEQDSSLQFQPVDLNELVKIIVERSTPVVVAKSQGFDYRTEMRSARVLGDPTAITKAITHVVKNAIDYTPDEGTITLRLYGDGENAVVEVVDSGIGISAEDLPHIFDSFYRVDSARPTESGDAGLGLSIAKRIVELMKGHMEVQSKLGEGSIFKIYLPLHP